MTRVTWIAVMTKLSGMTKVQITGMTRVTRMTRMTRVTTCKTPGCQNPWW